ncbi:MAG: response regulator [bacterium]
MFKKKILVVEDESDIAENIVVRLEAEGYNTIYASNGKSAIDSSLEEKPDLILLDIMLPKLDGIEVCKVLKSKSKLKNVPILMLTSLNAVGDVEKAFQAGANDYLAKPFEYDRLLSKIRKLLDEV